MYNANSEKEDKLYDPEEAWFIDQAWAVNIERSYQNTKINKRLLMQSFQHLRKNEARYKRHLEIINILFLTVIDHYTFHIIYKNLHLLFASIARKVFPR